MRGHLKINRVLAFRLFLGLAAAAIVLLMGAAGWLKRLEFLNNDSYVDLREKKASDPRIIIVEISDYDIARIGRWPWQRTWFAALSRALTEWGARSVYFDIVCSEHASEEEDAVFEEAIRESRNVYLPMAFMQDSLDTRKAFLPLERFSRHARGVGAINIFPDKDGILRRIPLVFPSDKQLYFQAGALLAMDYAGLAFRDWNERELVIGSGERTISVPLENSRFMHINWLGRWENTFRHYSILDILAEYQNRKEGKPPAFDISNFEGSICLVGVTSLGLYDIKATPVQPEYPAVGIVATVVDNILNNDFLRTVPWRVTALCVLFLCLVIALVTTGNSPHGEVLFLLLMSVACFYIGLMLFGRGYFLNSYLLILGMLLAYSVTELYNFYAAVREKQRLLHMAVTDGLTGLYNINYFKVAVETEILLVRADPHKSFSVIMCDIDHFKAVNDTLGHQVGDAMIKEIADALKASVRAADVAARYGGDEIIILLRGAGSQGCRICAEKLRQNVETMASKKQGPESKVTLSVGFATYRKNDTAESIIKRADEGLYKSKQGGRNRISTVED